MISYLSGVVLDKLPTELTVLTGGVGYQVAVPARVSADLKLQAQVNLHIYTHVREDTISLFGFTEKTDRRLFAQLISVSGIGPKTALAILSISTADSIASAVREADVDFFSAIPGIGRKSAQRIIVDLKSKLGTIKELDLSEPDSSAHQALKSLGFSKEEASKAISKITHKAELSDPELIRLALKNLGK